MFLLGTIMMSTLSLGAAGGLSGYIHSLLTKPSDTINQTKGLLNGEVTLRNFGRFLTENSGRSAICIQAGRQGLEALVGRGEVSSIGHALLGYGFNYSSVCSMGLSGISGESIQSILQSGYLDEDGFPIISELQKEVSIINNVSIATYFYNNLIVGKIIDLDHTRPLWVDPREYQACLQGDFECENWIAGASFMATASEADYSNPLMYRPYHFWFDANGLSDMGYVYETSENLESIINNELYTVLSFNTENGYRIGSLTNDNIELAFVSPFNLYRTNSQLIREELSIDELLELSAVYKNTNNAEICVDGNNNAKFILGINDELVPENISQSFAFQAAVLITTPEGQCVIADDEGHRTYSVVHNGELRQVGKFNHEGSDYFLRFSENRVNPFLVITSEEGR